MLEAEPSAPISGQQVDRHDVHEVEQQDPAEDRQRERRDQLAGAVEGVAHLRVDEIDQHFDEAAGTCRARRSSALRAASQNETDEHHAEQHREEDAVDVEGPEAFAVLQIGQVVNDVLAPVWAVFGCVFMLLTSISLPNASPRSRCPPDGRQRIRERNPVHEQRGDVGAEQRGERNLHRHEHHDEQRHRHGELRRLHPRRRRAPRARPRRPPGDAKPMSASAALAMAEMPPPTSADKPATRPQTAKQIAAATTVTTTWPSTTLAASRLAWGNSRVTTTLLLQVDNPRTQLRAREGRRLCQRCSKIVWLGNDLRVPWPGARIIYADLWPFNKKQKDAIFPGFFTYRGVRNSQMPAIA